MRKLQQAVNLYRYVLQTRCGGPKFSNMSARWHPGAVSPMGVRKPHLKVSTLCFLWHPRAISPMSANLRMITVVCLLLSSPMHAHISV